ncbi:MAG: ABC transporter ATP-binding protein [Thermoanaerobaculia bacterium]|nr:ABC transporter ATP-binding protein [Thermoanaerobaculia bacterium]
MSAPLARAEGVTAHLPGGFRLGPLDLAVERGECLAVVGPNGAGKTTLLRLLAGLLAPGRGRMLWQEEPYAAASRRQLARRIAYVPQVRPARIPLTVRQLVLQGRFPHLPRFGSPTAEDYREVAAALATVGIAALADRPVDALSGGERQAVFIAAALAQEAPLLVLDEPTTHLDPGHQRDAAALVRRLSQTAGRTVVTATHDLNFASLVATRILALRDGRALTCDVPRRLLTAEMLGELFDAPFAVVRGGERPITVLELDG